MKEESNELLTVKEASQLLNHISLIPVNPAKCPRVYHEEALSFVKWLTDPGKGQRIIGNFGREKYGQPLFFPESDAFKAKKKQVQ